jgi:hypothetical protein
MATRPPRVYIQRFNTTQVRVEAPATNRLARDGEVFFDPATRSLRMGDGATVGGNILATADGLQTNQLINDEAALVLEADGDIVIQGTIRDESGVDLLAAANGAPALPTASSTVKGGIKVGANLSIDGDGVLSAEDGNYSLPAATGSVLGGVKLGEGFVLDATDKVTTSKLYSTNLTQPAQHYRMELDTNGVVILPDGSIINGSTVRGVAGTGEMNYTGITIGPNVNDAEKTWMWVDHANAYVTTNNAANTWTFGNAGALTLPSDGVIQSPDTNSTIKTVIAVTHTDVSNDGEWYTATYTGWSEGNGQIVFVDPSPSFRQFLTQRLSESMATTITVNGNVSLTYDSHSIEPSQIILYIEEAPATDPTVITSISISIVAENRMSITGGMDQSMDFVSGSGWGVNIESRYTGDVSIQAGDDVYIRAGDKAISDTNGGDIDIISGRGGFADHVEMGGAGGDIDIRAEQGGNASSLNAGGDGGVTTIRSGNGGTANGAGNQQAGYGANLFLYAGSGGYNEENAALGRLGGDVHIQGGASTNNQPGGAIFLLAGQGGGTQGSGSITLRTKIENNAADRDLVFDNTGTLTLPNGNKIGGAEIPPVEANTTTITNYAYDATGTTVMLGAGDTVDFPNFSGSVLVNAYLSGTVTQYLCGGGGLGATVTGSSKLEAPTGTMADNGSIAGYTFTATELGNHCFYVVRTRTGA